MLVGFFLGVGIGMVFFTSHTFATRSIIRCYAIAMKTRRGVARPTVKTHGSRSSRAPMPIWIDSGTETLWISKPRERFSCIECIRSMTKDATLEG